MTFEEMNQIVDTQLSECRALLLTKGNDYSPTKDRLGSFKGAAARLGLTPLQVLNVYLDKHLQAVQSYISKGRVESEPIEGRISDVINYMILMRALITEETK